jgi:Domain of unknown function (DUF4173)
MSSIPITALPMPVLSDTVPRKLAIAAGATAFADRLFYDHGIGLSLALFLLVLAGLSLLINRVQTSRRQALTAVVILIAGVAPIVEDLDIVSVLFGIAAVAVAVSSVTNPFIESLGDRLKAVLSLLLAGPFRLLPDLARSRIWSFSPGHLAVWIMPLLLGGIFLLLFARANPLIEQMLAALDPSRGISRFSLPRLLFWVAMASVIWPFIQLRWRPKAGEMTGEVRADMTPQDAAPAHPENAIDALLREMFAPAAILRSLVLFNVLFAVQTMLDLVYLWGGVALPDGMTYASYAHRGAYPLMLTALLAAGFVLLAIAPGGAAERKPAIRVLVFAWIAQNVMLVISSVLRLDLYVETYSLTYWRVAAFIWMLLVAAGLVLMNRWLVLANLTTLALVLYACAFINFPWAISTYNVAHSREMSGKGASVDFPYLASLGPQALPAMDRYLRLRSSGHVEDSSGSPLWDMNQQRDRLVQQHSRALDSWRAWNFRGWRLQRYLDQATRNSVGPQ